MSNINQQVIERIAKVCHEANRAYCGAYCAAMGDLTQPSWADAPEWQKSSTINSVCFHIENPDATPENSHESWLKQKQEEGWTYGPVKDAEKKEHPCFVPYADLPVEQKAKDYIFRAIIHAMYTPTVLMGSENHHGWKLEELMDQLIGEILAKTAKIADDRSPTAMLVTSNNRLICSQLMTSAILQRMSYEALSKLGPNQGPAGTPRIGPGSEGEA